MIPENISMEVVASSGIAKIGHDMVTNELYVEFSKGALYKYSQVPRTVYNELIQASSTGKLFYSKVSKKYKFKRLDE